MAVKKTAAKKAGKKRIHSTDMPDMEETVNSNQGKHRLVTPKRLIFLFLILALGYFLYPKLAGTGADTENLKTNVVPMAVKKIISNENAKIKVENWKEANGVYQFDLIIDAGSGEQKYNSYISKDGKVIFQSGINVDSLSTLPTQTQKKVSCDTVDKNENPALTAFVVSQCPYGIQMQRVFRKALEEQPELKKYLNIKYIGSVDGNKITAMHGEEEAEENLRQICIREEQNDKFYNYLSCYMKEGKSEECLTSSGISSALLDSCVQDTAKGVKYAQADFDIQNKFNIGSSPTLLLNGKQVISESDFGGRTPNSLKEIVCCSMDKKADFCSKDMSKDSVAVSFSADDASSNPNSAANCN